MFPFLIFLYHVKNIPAVEEINCDADGNLAS